jgi:hypothetical protein
VRTHWRAEAGCVFARVADDNSARLVARLGGVPILDGNVHPRLQRGAKLKVLCGFLQLIRPVLVAKTNQPFPVAGKAAYFFGKMRVSTSSTTWMMLLLRSGDRAMISDAAAKPTAIIAVVAGSMVSTKYPQKYSSGFALVL